MLGYIGIVNDSKIVKYNSDRERKEITVENKGKQIRQIVGEESLEKMEEWLVSKGNLKYKIVKGDEINYFRTLEKAKALCWGESKVQTLDGKVVYTAEENRKITKDMRVTKSENNKIDVTRGVNISKMGGIGKDISQISTQELYEHTISCVRLINNLSNSYLGIISDLYRRLEEIDKVILDIEHDIEFNVLDKNEGYNIYKELHETLVERRQIKDMIQILDIIIEVKLKDSNTVIKENFDRLNNRKYNYRSKSRESKYK